MDTDNIEEEAAIMVVIGRCCGILLVAVGALQQQGRCVVRIAAVAVVVVMGRIRGIPRK